MHHLFLGLFTMSFDSAWIFRICLVMAVTLILFADFLGYGGANARKSDKSDDYEDYIDEDHHQPSVIHVDKGEVIKLIMQPALGTSANA